MAKSKAKQTKQKKVDFDVLKQINLNAAGIDIGSELIYVSVSEDRDAEPVRCFYSYTSDLQEIATWLKACNIDTVAMESTSVYWVSLFDILEEQGFEVYLVNARHVKNVSGRKTDVLDCQWLRQLHTYGLLTASFHPSEDIRAIRSLVRHRDMLVTYRGAHIRHMQKALDLMNLKLHVVLSDISGQTGMAIIRAIVAGEHRPEILASLRNGQCKHSEKDIAKALTGYYRPEHLFELKQALALYDAYGEQMQACDQELERYYKVFAKTSKTNTLEVPSSSKRKYRRGNDVSFNLRDYLFKLVGVDLTEIDGLAALSVQAILTEVGLDMSKFKTAKHFASWMCLAPNNKITGGKILRSRTRKVKNRAAQSFRMAAQSLSRSKSALGAFYRRIKAKHGSPVAITAAANKLARIFYTVLKTKIPYHHQASDAYEESQQKLHLKRLHKQAAKLGFELQPMPSA